MTPSPTPRQVLDASRSAFFALLRMQVCEQDAAHLQTLQMLSIDLEKVRMRLTHQVEDKTLETATLDAFYQQVQNLIKQIDIFCPTCKGHAQQSFRQAGFFETYMQLPNTLQ